MALPVGPLLQLLAELRDEKWAPLLLLGPVLLAIWALYRARLRTESLLRGRVIGVDNGGRGGGVPLLASPRYRVRGRPDEIRRLPNGTLIPVEIKSRPAPAGGVLPSHRIQLMAYCLLVEEATGRSPPYGILVYGDGTELQVPWGPQARNELLNRVEIIRRPYGGSLTPSRAKCHACRFRRVCEGARQVGAAP